MPSVVGGRAFDYDRADVERAMSGMTAEPLREHLVVVNGVAYPPKQVLAVLTGWERGTFTTNEAQRVLQQLGFESRRTSEVGPPPVGRGSYAIAPVLDEALEAKMQAAKDRLLAEARDQWQRGYAQGMGLASECNWDELRFITERGLLRAAKENRRIAEEIMLESQFYPDGARPPVDQGKLILLLGLHADHTGTAEWKPQELVVEGMDAAVRQFFAELTQETTSELGDE